VVASGNNKGGGGGSGGTNGADGFDSSGNYEGGTGGNYGGGAGGGAEGARPNSTGANGAVRIIWGTGRAFPTTSVSAISSTDGETTV